MLPHCQTQGVKVAHRYPLQLSETPMALQEQLTSFALYRWRNPETTCDSPFLALSEDGTVLLSLGDYRLGIAWDVSADAAAWLAQDFAATGETLTCDLASVRVVLDALYSGAARFAVIGFDERLQPERLELSLTSQQAADDGPVFVIQSLEPPLRLHPAEQRTAPATDAERALIQVFVEGIAGLTRAHEAQLVAPPPPRYQPPTGQRGRRRPPYRA
jgi:hypothetical protein